MKIPFTKMHGAGNDYIFINCMESLLFDPPKMSVMMSERHYSVGADGIILALPSLIADAKMSIFNADGSEARMCGNGIRCFARYLIDEAIVEPSRDYVTVETLSGVHRVNILHSDITGNSHMEVKMLSPDFRPESIPMNLSQPMMGNTLNICGKAYTACAVSVGNPHLVLFTDDVNTVVLKDIAADISSRSLFPDGINIELVQVVRRNCLFMRVFERGCGETLACGTGACAAAVASVCNGYCRFDEMIEVGSAGGKLYVTYGIDDDLWLSGDVNIAFHGEYEYND